MDKRAINDHLYTGNSRCGDRNAQGRLAMENDLNTNDCQHHQHHQHHNCHDDNRGGGLNYLIPVLVIGLLLFRNDDRCTN